MISLQTKLHPATPGRLPQPPASLDPEHRLLHRHRDELLNKALLRWQNGVANPLHDSFDAFLDALLAGIEATLARPAGNQSPATRHVP
ncbi:MAG: hypothetical protein WCD11_31555 [Solirubrobacteraceae bacterium]